MCAKLVVYPPDGRGWRRVRYDGVAIGVTHKASDLATASVRQLQVERAGTRLTAFLQLVAHRRFAIEESTPAPPALLDVWLDGVTDAAFDLSDTRGVILDARPPEIAISLGTGGRLRAATGEYRLDDRSWHLSAAGRRADAVAEELALGRDGKGL